MKEREEKPMNTDENQITILYKGSSFEDKKTLAVAEDNRIPILEIDIEKDGLTGTQLLELASEIKIDLEKLVKTDLPEFREKFSGDGFSTEDWIKILRNNPRFLKTPVAMRGEQIILIETPTDLLKLSKSEA